MALKRTAKQSIPPIMQPSPKRRRLNSSLPSIPNTASSSSSTSNNPCTTSPPSYHDYAKKFMKKMRFNDKHKHEFVSSLDTISYLYGHKSCVNTVCWEKSGRHLCSGSDDETVRIWDVFALQNNGKTPKMLCILKGHLSNVFTAKFMYTSSVSGINNIVASGGNDADIHIYDINHSPFTFRNRNTLCTAQSIFVNPMYSYHHHSRKVLKISVHPQKPFEILSCSADGTIRHFDIRQKYKQQKFSTSPQDIITQGFGGGPSTNRGRFRESLLYDFNTFNKHWPIYSIAINPIKSTEIVTCCGDGYIRIFDLRKHSNGSYNNAAYILNGANTENGINSFSKYNRNNAISSFYNFRMKFPQHCHPTDCVYNSDGSEILTTHIHDALYLYINPTTVSNTNNRTCDDEIEDKIREFIENDENEDENEEKDDSIQDEDQDEQDDEDSDEQDDEDAAEFANMLNFAVYSRITAAALTRNGTDDGTRSDGDAVHIILDNDLLDYVETLVDRRKEVLRINGGEHNFQQILFDLITKQKQKLKWKRKGKCVLFDVDNDDMIRRMKWNENMEINSKQNTENNMNLPPIDSNMEIINHYENEHYVRAYSKYEEKQSANTNGMNIAQESQLYDLTKNVYYFGRYIGHIHCETIKETAFFGDNYVMTGSDDKKIYIYHRLNGDCVNILHNKNNIVNNIAVNPNLPIFVSSGLDSHITMWGPKGWNKNGDDHDKHNEDDIDMKHHQFKCTQRCVNNVVRLRHRAGFDIL